MFATVESRQRPVPVIPSSQVVHPSEHVSHVLPKKPLAQASVKDEEVSSAPRRENESWQTYCKSSRKSQASKRRSSWLHILHRSRKG